MHTRRPSANVSDSSSFCGFLRFSPSGRPPGAFVGEMDKAKATRQDFFALEINANPGIPILKEAKAECTKL